jgi:hypothetical protein
MTEVIRINPKNTNEKIIKNNTRNPPPSKSKSVFKVEDLEIDSTSKPPKLSPSPPLSKPEPSQTCIGPNVHKHVTRDTLANNIEDFCAQAVDQDVQDRDSDSLGREFNIGTSEHAAIVMTWLSGSSFKSFEADCNHYLADMFMNGCSDNEPKNSMN